MCSGIGIGIAAAPLKGLLILANEAVAPVALELQRGVDVLAPIQHPAGCPALVFRQLHQNSPAHPSVSVAYLHMTELVHVALLPAAASVRLWRPLATQNSQEKEGSKSKYPG